ncbi:MAG: 50S ribosomal protein L11 methyltransferase [Sphingobacteriaceae bacterium]|nr:50S ribosomal protein L11 methyltransferase [Sphingobacteriaceae bacterium]
MRYLKYVLHSTEDFKEVLLAELAEVGFDTFDDSKPSKLEAWVTEANHDAEAVQFILERYAPWISKVEGPEVEPEKNWNETWESQYEAVNIDGWVHIRAPFHPIPTATFEHVLEIMPKMSFGTGHHGTTAGILRTMSGLPFEGKRVLDMGCGTGVLGILAAKMGASRVLGIDIEPWAVENALENAERNAVQMEVLEGGKELIDGSFDVILANINRNIIVDQLPEYARVMEKGGILVCSGFYRQDVDIIRENAALNGFAFVSEKNEDQWANVVFSKA